MYFMLYDAARRRAPETRVESCTPRAGKLQAPAGAAERVRGPGFSDDESASREEARRLPEERSLRGRWLRSRRLLRGRLPRLPLRLRSGEADRPAAASA